MEPYSYQLKHDVEGRIIEKTESVSGKPFVWIYAYDSEDRLEQARLDGRLVFQCSYDKQGRRMQDCFPRTHGNRARKYSYGLGNRLQSVANNGYTHDKNGFRMLWNAGGRYTRYTYAPDNRLLKVEDEESGNIFEFFHDNKGRREFKRLNGNVVEAYQWQDDTSLVAFWNGQDFYELLYDTEARAPYAMHGEDGAAYYLYYDQVGSLRVVADQSGYVIKEILYDPFGGIIEDTAPDFRIPIGFAGGLYDQDLGFVRFGWRDYDTFTGRWTTLDPMGEAGGDDDWYSYCLDDPVNLVDPLGLMGSKPEPPEMSEPYFQDSWEWQTNHDACAKCNSFDGMIIHGSLSSAPKPPHPNCKCQIVECEYYSTFGKWEEVERIVLGYKITGVICGGAKCRVSWERKCKVREQRDRFYWRQCGSRIPGLISKGQSQKRDRYETEGESGPGMSTYHGGDPTQGDILSAQNPWTGRWIPVPRPSGS